MKVFNLPAGTPAQVRSWNTDYQCEVLKLDVLLKKDVGPAVIASQRHRAEIAGNKVQRYLDAVSKLGGKVIQPPKTHVETELEIGRKRRLIGGSKLEYRSNY